jgi:hypothetical protein
VTASLAGQPVAGLTLRLHPDQVGQAGAIGVTDATGRVVLSGVVVRAAGWSIVPALAVAGAVPPSPLRLAVPAAVSIPSGRLSARRYSRVGGRISVYAYVRATPAVPASVLAGHAIQFYLQRSGHASRYVGRVFVTSTAKVAGSLRLPYAGVLRMQFRSGDPLLPGRVLDRVSVR